ncbi:MAG: transcriptional regulator GcvA [Notoacmeibacter sp.]|nr:transcriptional regulator GcvA [Alphaproteobacteria bacterium]MCB1426268.1 transcriptional regulator GcvA [Notoacmeibacter sp.]
MPKLPPLNALKCLEAAARSQSFSKAADELHVTQSAVSHQIRQLEDWFGLSLFDRKGRQTVPTAKGEELARALAEAFDIMAVACKRVAQSDAGQAITIAALPSIATIWLIPRLSRFFAEHPQVAVKVVYAFHDQRLDFEDIDIAILWGTGDWEGCQASRLLEGSTVAVCNAGFLDKEGPFDSPQALLGKPLLHDTNRLGWQSWMRSSGLKNAGPARGPIFQDFNLLRAAALAGQGVALCPRSLIVDDLASGRLIQIFDTTVMKDRAYYMVEPAETQHRHSAALATVKAWLIAEATNAAT